MKKEKIIVLLLAFVFSVCVIQANECKVNNVNDQKNFSFMNYSKDLTSLNNWGLTNNEITKYKWSNERKSTFFLRMGIAGAAVAGGGLLLTIPGIALLAAGYSKAGGAIADPSSSSVDDAVDAYNMFIAGAVLLGLGVPTLVIGIGVLIPGFVLYSMFKKKVAMFIDAESGNTRIGLAIKL